MENGIKESAKVQGISHRILRNKYNLVMIAFVFINFVAYSWLDLERYASFNSGIMDLGVNSSLLYGVLHGGVTTHALLNREISLNKPIYLLMGLFYGIFPSQIGLLVFQSLWLSIGGFLVFQISRQILSEYLSSTLIGISYLLYYPLLGTYWFDFHFMAIFPTFFLLAFYYYLHGKNKKLITFAFLAATTDLLAPILIGFLGLYILALHSKGHAKNNSGKNIAYLLILLSLIIFIISLAYLGINFVNGYTYSHASLDSISLHNSNLQKFSFIFQITFPTLFFSFISPETMLLSVPYFVLALKNNYTPYLSTMFYQYPALFSPALFISMIYGIKRVKDLKFIIRKTKILKMIGIAIITTNILMAAFFSPLGNLITSNYNNENIQKILTGSVGTYNTGGEIHVTGYDHALQKMVRLIPKGSSVLVQGNMPQLVQGYNWVLPFYLSPNEYPQYIVTDPYSNLFTHFSLYARGNYTMYNAVNHLISTHKYGIVCEYEGAVMLKLDYGGNILMYKPITQVLGSQSLKFNKSANFQNNKVTFNNLTDNSAAWYGPYSFLSPGNYSIILNISASNLSNNNNFQFQIVYTNIYGGNQNIALRANINGSNLMNNSISEITFNFSTNRYLESVEYRAFYFDWSGEFTFYNVTVVQTSPKL